MLHDLRCFSNIIQVSENGLATADGLFVSNDLLLHLKTANNTNTNGHIVEKQLVSDVNINETNGNNEELAMEIDHRSDELQWNDLDVIHMLNNGSIIAVDKSALNTVTIAASDTEESEITYNKLFEEVSALKCKLCSFLCEHQQQIIEHLKSEHISRVNKIFV